MHPITTPIKTDNKESVTNLHAALVFLLSKQSLTLTADELKALQKQWQQEQQEAAYGEVTTKLVAIFQQHYKVDDKAGMVEEPTAAQLNEVLKGLGAFDEVVKSFLVKGTISWSDGKPYSGVTVKAYDADLRRVELLGMATTDEKGFYEIAYTQQQFINSEKENADVLIGIYANETDKKPLKSSDVFFNAKAIQEINLSIPTTTEVPASEWEMIDAQLKPLLKDQYELPQAVNVYRNLLPEELETSDFEFLSKDIGIDKGNIELWSLAYKSAGVTDGVSREAFYGWFRMGMPTTLKELWLRSVEELSTKLKNAKDQNIIPGLKEAVNNIPNTNLVPLVFHPAGLQNFSVNGTGNISQARLLYQLSPAIAGDAASLGDAINTLSITISDDDKVTIASVVLDSHDTSQIAKKLIEEKNFDKQVSFAIQRTVGLQNLSQNYLPIIKNLGIDGANEATASLMDLTSLSKNDWHKMVKETGAPENYMGPDKESREKNYANDLAATIENKYPTLVTAHSIQKGGWKNVLPAVGSFLIDNPQIDLNKENVYDLPADIQAQMVDFKIDDLGALQRVIKLSPSVEVTNFLSGYGFTSAAGILNEMNKLYPELIELTGYANTRDIMYNIATAVGITNIQLGAYIDANTKIDAIPNTGFTEAGSTSIFDNDYCSCDHCSSVLSPAAYFVDLLKLLDFNNADSVKSIDALLKRRPDIGETALSCENAETPVVYLDLALEILENDITPKENRIRQANKIAAIVDDFKNGVVNPLLNDYWITIPENTVVIKSNNKYKASWDGWIFTAEIINNTLVIKYYPQTASAPNNLDADYHLYTPSYEPLANAYYPWTLPLNLPVENANAYLKKLGFSRNEAMKILENTSATTTAFDETEWANDVLGITSGNVANIINQSLEAARWGVANFDELSSNINKLLHHSGLSYDDFKRIIKLDFIKQGAMLHVNLGTEIIDKKYVETCDLGKAKITGLSPEHFDRIHRFVRLWRVLVIEPELLDHLITIIGNKLDQDFLKTLAYIFDISKKYSISLDNLLTFLNNPSKINLCVLFKTSLQELSNFLQLLQITDAEVADLKKMNLISQHLSHWQLLKSKGLNATEITFWLTDEDTIPAQYQPSDKEAKQFAEAIQAKLTAVPGNEDNASAEAVDVRTAIEDDALVIIIATSFGVDETIVNILKNKFPVVKSYLDALKSRSSQVDAFNKIYKVTRVINKLKLTGLELNWLVSLERQEWLTANQITDFIKLLELVELSNTYSKSTSVITDYLEDYVHFRDKTFLDNAPWEVMIKYGIRFLSNLNQACYQVPATNLDTIITNQLTLEFITDPGIFEYLFSKSPRFKTALNALKERTFLNLKSSNINASNCSAQLDAYKKISRTFNFIREFGINVQLLDKILNSLPHDMIVPESFPEFLKFGEMIEFKKYYSNDLNIFTTYKKNTLIRRITFLNKRLSWTPEELTLLKLPDPGEIAADSFASTFINLKKLFDQLRVTGINLAELQVIAGKDYAGAILPLSKQLLSRKYSGIDLQQASKAIQDTMRVRRRDALVDFIINRDRLASADTLYEKYFIDPQMAPCSITSRLKQAIASVQLFVFRCMGGIEKDENNNKIILPGAKQKQWEWMKNYRVWEANRKIFLYPENWLSPDLRTNKSAFFREFESEMLQNEVTSKQAGIALGNYVNKLAAIGKLEIVCAYQDGNNLHLVGRTKTSPAEYYYCIFDSLSNNWTAWEKIDLDITGIHIMITVVDKMPYLVWATFQKKNKPVVNVRKYEIQLCYSNYLGGKWQSKKLSDRLDYFPQTQNIINNLLDDYSDFAFSISNSGDGFHVSVFGLSIMPTQILSTNPVKPTIVDNVVSIATGQDFLILFLDEAGYPIGNVSIEIVSDYGNRQMASSNDGGIVIGISGQPTKCNLTSGNYEIDILSKNHNNTNRTGWIDTNSIPQGAYYPAEQNYFGVRYADDYVYAYAISQGMRCFRVILKPKLAVTTSVNTSNESQGYIGNFTFNKIANSLNNEGDLSKSFEKWEGLDVKGNLFTESKELTRSQPLTISNDISIELLKTTPGNLYTVFKIPGSNAAIYQDDFGSYIYSKDNTGKYIFLKLYHPYVNAFQTLNISIGSGVMLALKNQCLIDNIPQLNPIPADNTYGGNYFLNTYTDINSIPKLLPALSSDLPGKTVDFVSKAIFSLYNWELFFHLPFHSARQLSQNQHFNDAREWLHYLFNPTIDVTNAVEYWQCRPLRQAAADPAGGSLLKLTASDNPDLIKAVQEWIDAPFQPDVVAKNRPLAYNKAVLMSYLDNLIDWADQLYSRDTIESVNEATMLYVLASNILGERPREVKRTTAANHFTYNDKRDVFNSLDNILIKLENTVPGASANIGAPGKMIALEDMPVLPDVYTPFFCIPHNEKLLGYWDIIENRLFNIRNCKNMQGVERQLALWEPPIDPALLVRAAAMGVDIADIISSLNEPSLPYKYQTLLRTAQDVCNEVKALGSALLSALEKKDAEQLSRLRSTHELDMLQRVREIKEQQINESEVALEGLRQNKTSAVERYKRFQYLLRKEILIPAEGQIVAADNGVIKYPSANPQDENGKFSLSNNEYEQLLMLDKANTFNVIGNSIKVLSSIVHMLPNVTLVAAQFGGSNLGHAASAASDGFSIGSTIASHDAQRSSIMGGYERRFEEWTFQSNSVLHEIQQIDKQITASEIRVAITQNELKNHDRQIENTQEIDEWLRNKFTNAELYNWMQGQLFSMYKMAYTMALQLAKKTEKAYGYELGEDSLNKYIKPNYWDSMKKGLLSGELLSLDIKRMEIAYLEKNKREFEMTKHISAAMIQPLSILKLRETGSCDIDLPEELFDLDFPGHYFRRIKSVSISIPCVAGPYTSINATLRLVKNEYRFKTTDPTIYAKLPDDPRFREISNPVTAITTSSSQNDSGVFELNFRDERYLPFEGAGAISTWRLELGSDIKLRQFDYNTISDIILHLKYTAREDSALKQPAMDNLNRIISDVAESKTFTRLLSFKNDFPDKFHLIKAGNVKIIVPDVSITGLDHSVELEIGKIFFPYFTNNFNIKFQGCEFFKKDGSGFTLYKFSTDPQPEKNELPVKSINPVDGSQQIDDNWKLIIHYNFTELVRQIMDGDILMLINYKLSTPSTTP
ncbi:hypothetical protein BH11BAC3_BH11BAC3_12890 [soil metagenome]